MLSMRHTGRMGSLSTSERIRALAALVTAVVLWGSAFVGIRAIVSSNAYTPGQLSAGRLALASLLLGVLAVARGGVRIPTRGDLPRLLLMGATGQMLYHLLLNTGERTVDGGTASLLVATSPILASLLAVSFLGERLTPLGWAGMAVAFAGAATIATASGISFTGGSGVLLVVIATCLWAVYLVTQKPLSARYDSFELTAWPMWIGAVLLLPFGRGLFHAVRVAPPTATFALVWLAVFASVAGFLAWSYALHRLAVTVATSALYTVPVAAFVIGVLFLREMPPASALLGGVIAIAGVALVQLKGRPAAA